MILRWPAFTFLGILAALMGAGCATPALKPAPSPVAPPTAPPPASPQTHLLGNWELQSRNGTVKQMIFEADGRLQFHGGLEYFNPAQWSLDPQNQVLTITLPNASNEKLDIFHQYVGSGVQAFNRERKEVTYHFDESVWSLNFAGWIYSKSEPMAAPPAEEAEPIIR